MISDADLDRVLRSWLSEGGAERAPDPHVRAALATAAGTRQRRPLLPLGRIGRDGDRWMPIMLAALLLVVLGLGVGIGTGLLRPTPPSPPTPPDAGVPASPRFGAWGLDLEVPVGWTLAQATCCELLRFEGPGAGESLSIAHDSPSHATVCRPGCTGIDLPQYLPWSAGATVDALAARIGDLVDTGTWVRDDTVPGLLEGRRLDVTIAAGTRTDVRQVYVIGVNGHAVVAVTWVQSAAAFDGRLLDRTLASLELRPQAGYAVGDLVPFADAVLGYALSVPDTWSMTDQPLVGGLPASGVRRFGPGRLEVSVGDPWGELGPGIPSLDDLDATLGAGAPGFVRHDSGSTDLGGDPARWSEVTFRASDGRPLRSHRVYALHDGLPVVLSFNITDGTIAREAIDAIVDSFRFTTTTAAGTVKLATPGAGVELALPPGWQAEPGAAPGVLHVRHGGQELTVTRGDERGAIWTCDVPVGRREACREVTATSLEALAGAIAPDPGDDRVVRPPGLSRPLVMRDSVVLDGEPAIALQREWYGGPNGGAAALAYVIAFHDGRPYIVRAWSTRGASPIDLGAVINGFRFTE